MGKAVLILLIINVVLSVAIGKTIYASILWLPWILWIGMLAGWIGLAIQGWSIRWAARQARRGWEQQDRK